MAIQDLYISNQAVTGDAASQALLTQAIHLIDQAHSKINQALNRSTTAHQAQTATNNGPSWTASIGASQSGNLRLDQSTLDPAELQPATSSVSASKS